MAGNGNGRGPRRILPILDWGRGYGIGTLTDDLLAAVIVTIMLVPQSLACAMPAGLPPQVGLYGSILPLLAYALFGTSRTLAVGPVAVISLMTAAAVSQLGLASPAEAIAAAAALALISGLMLVLMGIFRLAGFITASGILIALSQIRHILGIEASGHTLPEMLVSLWANIDATNLPTLILGLATLAFLFAARSRLKPLLGRLGVPARAADIATKVAPIVAVAATIAAAALLALPGAGVRIVGAIPTGLPPFGLPPLDPGLWMQLAGAALLISVIGFVESVSVAQTLAAKRRERIDPDQELVGLGASNVASAVSGGFPVTGGFARSVVNFDAGARTPAAGAFTAAGIALGTLFLTPWLFYLPQATLAATIIVAVLGLVDLGVLKDMGLFQGRLRRRSDDDPRQPRRRRRGGRSSLARPLSLPHQPAAYGDCRPRARDRAFPQHTPPRGPLACSPCASTRASISPMPATSRTGSTTWSPRAPTSSMSS
jgi:sulfate permease, SulP family